MTLLLWCVVVGVFLPYLSHLPVMYGRYVSPEGYDRHLPRAQSSRLQGLPGRAWAAQQNAWEAVTVFAPVALIAWFVGTDESANGLLGIGWVVFRLGHVVAYVADRPALRSTMFSLSLGCVLGLVVLAATA